MNPKVNRFIKSMLKSKLALTVIVLDISMLFGYYKTIARRLEALEKGWYTPFVMLVILLAVVFLLYISNGFTERAEIHNIDYNLTERIQEYQSLYEIYNHQRKIIAPLSRKTKQPFKIVTLSQALSTEYEFKDSTHELYNSPFDTL